MVKWLRIHLPMEGGVALMPDQGTKIPHATWYIKKKKVFINKYTLKINKYNPFIKNTTSKKT